MSNLQVEVEPSQSSFFAGEDFHCIITFTNTLLPTPQTQPLPSISAFGNGNGDSQHQLHPRAVSSAAAAPSHLHSDALGSSSHLAPLPGPSSSLAKGGAWATTKSHHAKSKSVDVKTFARQNQLASNYDEGNAEGEGGGDEGYYRRQRAEAEEEEGARTLQETDEGAEWWHMQLPPRKSLIGKGRHHLSPETMMGPPTRSTPAKKKHARSQTLSTGYNHATPQRGLGMGYPQTPTSAGSNGQHHPSLHHQLDAMALEQQQQQQQQQMLQTPNSSPLASRSPSSSMRRPSNQIAASHPHGRKKSVAQVQAEDLVATFELDKQGSQQPSPSEGNTPTQTMTPTTPRESFDLRQGSSSNSSGNRPNAFYNLGENNTMESVLREDFSNWARTRENGRRDSVSSVASSSVAAGPVTPKPQRPGQPSASPLFSTSQTAPGTESLLWSFAQFGGSFEINEALVKPGEYEEVKRKLAGGGTVNGPASSVPSTPVGGGEWGSEVLAAERSKDGWGSYLRGMLLRNAPPSSARASHRRTGSTLVDTREKTMASRSIPIFCTPPSIVAVDLNLAPGESRSYSYKIPLPPDLPPSYMGKSFSFTYTLTLGTNRLVKSKRGGGVTEQKSRLVRIPLRVYNLVSVTGVTAFFDLTNPVVNLKDEAAVKAVEAGRGFGDVDAKGLVRRDSVTRRERAAALNDGNERELVAYARDLLASCQDDTENDDDAPTDLERAAELAQLQARQSFSPSSSTSSGLDGGAQRPSLSPTQSLAPLPRPSSALGRRASATHFSGEDHDEPKTSMEAVEVLSRNSQKVSYDISKDGQVAAVLTFVKSKFRLGDTVSGVVTMNRSRSIARVVRIAATLETHEAVEPTLATLPVARMRQMTKRVHAEFHQDTLDAGQVGFQLTIPSGATPDFVTSGMRLAWTVRMSFLTLSAPRPEPGTNEGGASSINGGGSFSNKKRAVPPVHLEEVSSARDAFSVYHAALRGVSSLSGPHTPKPPSPTSSRAAKKEGEYEEEGEEEDANPNQEAKLEIVECAVPLHVLAHSTKFRTGSVSFTA